MKLQLWSIGNIRERMYKLHLDYIIKKYIKDY